MHDYSWLVNQCQHLEERRLKYAICRQEGCPRPEAIRLRDWNWSKLKGHLQRKRPELADEIEDLLEASYEVFSEHRKATERMVRRENRKRELEPKSEEDYSFYYPELAGSKQ